MVNKTEHFQKDLHEFGDRNFEQLINRIIQNIDLENLAFDLTSSISLSPSPSLPPWIALRNFFYSKDSGHIWCCNCNMFFMGLIWILIHINMILNVSIHTTTKVCMNMSKNKQPMTSNVRPTFYSDLRSACLADVLVCAWGRSMWSASVQPFRLAKGGHCDGACGLDVIITEVITMWRWATHIWDKYQIFKWVAAGELDFRSSWRWTSTHAKWSQLVSLILEPVVNLMTSDQLCGKKYVNNIEIREGSTTQLQQVIRFTAMGSHLSKISFS